METKTYHDSDCRRVFKHYDLNCPRCKELASGSVARKGWGDWKREQEARFSRELAAHDCKKSNCSVVCTFGDW